MRSKFKLLTYNLFYGLWFDRIIINLSFPVKCISLSNPNDDKEVIGMRSFCCRKLIEKSQRRIKNIFTVLG